MTDPMIPLQKSHAADDLEADLRDLFIKVYGDSLAEKADEINFYGAPHIGPFSLIEREIAKDGLAVLRTTNEDQMRHLFRAWRFRNPRRGTHFLRAYLQSLFGSSFDINLLWQRKDAEYPKVLLTQTEVTSRNLESEYYLTSRLRVDIETQVVPERLAQVLRTTVAARFVMEVRTAKYGRNTFGFAGVGSDGTGLLAGNRIYPPEWTMPHSGTGNSDYGKASRMLADLWSYIQRATGSSADEAGMPQLITNEGLVKNNQFVGGALGGYLADGAASSEGISLLMRGVANAYRVDKDRTKRDYMRFLMDAACKYFFFDSRPGADNSIPWRHTWLVNAGPAFNVRGPLAENGMLDQGGYIGVPVNFVNGRATLNPPPDIVYQVVPVGTEFVWDNVFSEGGERQDVDYYINAASQKIYGAQTGGSFGQPSELGAVEPVGTLQLRENLTGTYLVNYSISVPDVMIEYGEPYEGWPMWRKLAEGERAIAADAIHWFIDAFRHMEEADPGNPEWRLARYRLIDCWNECCLQESNNTSIFVSGDKGPYNNFPLTYSFAYGVDNVDDPSTQWQRRPPTDYYTALRTTDNYVTFTLPDTSAELGTGQPFRYGMAFENKPMYLRYESDSTLKLDVRASAQTVLTMTLESDEGVAYDGSLVVSANTAPFTMAMDQFLHFQDEAGDATGDRTGDWPDEPEEWVPPVYDARPYPGPVPGLGPRVALIGDSITQMNSVHVPPNSGNRYEVHMAGGVGYFNWAMALGNHSLEWEPGIQPNVNGRNVGYQFAISGSRVEDWWKESFDPLNDGVQQMGPMWAYNLAKAKIDVIVMMGGTNDLAGNRPAMDVLLNIKKAAYQCAADGKWVFLSTIMPRSTDELKGYTLAQQDAIRTRLLQVNAGIRNWIAADRPPNIFLVDVWDALVGPNGIDPQGCVSDRTSATGRYTPGNWKPGVPQVSFFPDGLHPGYAGAYVAGVEWNKAFIAAGIPQRNGYNLGPLGARPDLIWATPSSFHFPITTTAPATGYSNKLGRAIGLGSSLVDGSHQRPPDISPLNNLGLGYTHGQVPDNWFVYRASNADGESYSNFNKFTWSDFTSEYPELAPYVADSTWAEGSLTTSVVMIDGQAAFKAVFTTPQTGNKNEGFVITTSIPAHQNGPWNNYGYDTWPQTPPPVNDRFSPGEFIGAESEVRISDVVGLHTLQMRLSTFSLNEAAIGAGDMSSAGAVVAGLGMGPSFWPPSLIDLERFYPADMTLQLKAPLLKAPAPRSGERTYATVTFEVSVDASSGPASVTVIIRKPRMSIFTPFLGEL